MSETLCLHSTTIGKSEPGALVRSPLMLSLTTVASPFLITKLWSTMAILVLSLVCSYSPWIIRSRHRNSKTLMSYLNCLAGGVVFGALMMHMIPDITSHSTSVSCTFWHNHKHHHLPSKHNYDSKIEPHGHPPGNRHDCNGCGHIHNGHGSHQDNHGNTPYTQGLVKKGTKTTDPSHGQENDGDSEHNHGFDWGPFCAGTSFLLLLAIDRLFMHSHSQSHDHNFHGETSMVEKQAEATNKDFPHGHQPAQCVDAECGGRIHSADPENDDCASCHSDDIIGGCHTDGLDIRSSKTQALIFVIALSMHSFLEGLGMGSKNTQKSLILYLISLFAHKWLEAFALGVNVMNAAFTSWYAFVLIAFYSILTPVGIILGIFFERITVEGPHAEKVTLCLNGLAVGSFLFVSCIEMIPPEFHKKTHHTPWKFITLCVGFVLMAAISAIHYH